MARISYNDAVGLLTDVEKNRIVACYFAITDPNASIDFDLAAKEYGSASVDSFKKMISTALKKVEKHLENGTSPATPTSTKKTTPSNRGRKRKAAADDDDEFVSPTKTPAQTPKRTRAKKVKYEEVASEDEAEAGDAAGDYTGNSAVEAKPAAGENSATDESAIKGENAPKEELMVKLELAVKEESVKETEMA